MFSRIISIVVDSSQFFTMTAIYLISILIQSFYLPLGFPRGLFTVGLPVFPTNWIRDNIVTYSIKGCNSIPSSAMRFLSSRELFNGVFALYVSVLDLSWAVSSGSPCTLLITNQGRRANCIHVTTCICDPELLP